MRVASAGLLKLVRQTKNSTTASTLQRLRTTLKLREKHSVSAIRNEIVRGDLSLNALPRYSATSAPLLSVCHSLSAVVSFIREESFTAIRPVFHRKLSRARDVVPRAAAAARWSQRKGLAVPRCRFECWPRIFAKALTIRFLVTHLAETSNPTIFSRAGSTCTCGAALRLSSCRCATRRSSAPLFCTTSRVWASRRVASIQRARCARAALPLCITPRHAVLDKMRDTRCI